MIQALDAFTNAVPHLISAITALGVLVTAIVSVLNNRRFVKQDKMLDEIHQGVNSNNQAMVATTKDNTDKLADFVKVTTDKAADDLHSKVDELMAKVDEQAAEILRLHGMLEAKP